MLLLQLPNTKEYYFFHIFVEENNIILTFVELRIVVVTESIEVYEKTCPVRDCSRLQNILPIATRNQVENVGWVVAGRTEQRSER